VQKLIAGPTVFICNECVITCLNVISVHAYDESKNSGELNFCANADQDHTRVLKLQAGVWLVTEPGTGDSPLMRTIAHRVDELTISPPEDE
jgi:hypothetical protein